MAESLDRKGHRRAARLGLGAWTVAVLLTTLAPASVPPNPEELSFWCIACGGRGSADAILNLLFFIPGGYFARHLLAGRRAVWAALLASIALETLQAIIPGRYPSFSDVLFNGSGALLGVYLARPLAIRWAFRAGPLVAVLAWLAPLVLLEPVGPGTAIYGQWTPVVGGMGRFGGAVLDVTVADRPLPSWRLEDPRLIEALHRSRPLELTIRVGATPQGIAPVFSIADARGYRLLIVAAEDEDVAIHRRALASTLRLEQPLVWFEEALAGKATGDTARIGLTRDGGATCLHTSSRSLCVDHPGPERGWQFLVGSYLRPGPTPFVLSALWSLAVGALVGVGMASPIWGALGAVVLGLGTQALDSLMADAVVVAVWPGVLALGGALGGAFRRAYDRRPPASRSQGCARNGLL